MLSRYAANPAMTAELADGGGLLEHGTADVHSQAGLGGGWCAIQCRAMSMRLQTHTSGKPAR